MFDAHDALAKTRAGTIPASWMVARARIWRFAISTFLVLIGCYAIIKDASDKVSLTSTAVPVPTLTWDVPTGSGFLLTVTVLVVAFAILGWRFAQNRSRVIVFTPDGFVKGDLRTGQIERSAAYGETEGALIRNAREDEFEIIPRIHIDITNKAKQRTPWTIEDYFSIPAIEIARMIYIGAAAANRGSNARARYAASIIAPTEVAARVRAGEKVEGWTVIPAQLKLNFWRMTLVLIIIFGIIYGGFINAYFFTPGQGFADRYGGGRPFIEVLGSESFGYVVLILATWLLITSVIRQWRTFRLSREMVIFTQSQLVMASKRSGKVDRVVDFQTINNVSARHGFKFFTVRYHDASGKKQALIAPPDVFTLPATFCSLFFQRYARNLPE